MIKKDSIVSIRYSMWNSRGHLLEKSQATYVHGSSSIAARLQSQLEGLDAGESRIIHLKKGEENADDDFTFEVFITDVRTTPPPPPKIHLLSGFLGSGKTTAIAQACRHLGTKGISAAVITNDQGVHLVDGRFFEHLDIPAREVVNGCFCCNYNDLDAAIRHLHEHDAPEVIFAESVGSCTDLVATVLKPLLQQHPDWRTTTTTFADAQLLKDNTPNFDATIDYIYLKQLEEAQVVVVSKSDLVDTAKLKTQLQTRYPGKTILFQNSFDEADIARWLQTLDATSFTKDLPSLDIDYDTYGAGEAKLAWLDQQLEITSPDHSAQHAALTLIDNIAETRYPIGHLKFLLDGKTKISITSTGATQHHAPQPASHASLLINARIQTEPTVLSKLVADAIQSTATEHNCTIHTVTGSCFQPGYPSPTHRIS